MEKDTRHIRWFEEIKIGDIPTVGGKNASLGEMYRELAGQGVGIPNGFAVTAEAYGYVIESAGILDELKDAMAGLDKMTSLLATKIRGTTLWKNWPTVSGPSRRLSIRNLLSSA